jgi:hypothetical protein
MTTEKTCPIEKIRYAAAELHYLANGALKFPLLLTDKFDEAAEACALAIAEYLQARQEQRDAEMERMVERGQDAAEDARGRSGKFHYDEEMPLDEAFEG